MPGEANQGGWGQHGVGREALLGEQSPLSLSLPSAANAPAPRPRPSRPVSPLRPRHRHRHSPAGEAQTSLLLEMTLPGSLHTPSSLQRQIKRNPCGGEPLWEGQGAWGEEAESWGRCQSVAGHRSLGVSKREQPPEWYPRDAPAPGECAASDPAPTRGRDEAASDPLPGTALPVGPAGGDQNVTLPQECPAQWRGQGGRLPSCHRLIAYKVPYKHIVSKISCFQCRPAGFTIPHQHAAPRCHGVVPPVHA